MTEHIELRHALLIVRTDSDTWVMSDVTGTLDLQANVIEGAEHRYQLSTGGLTATEKDADRIRDFDLSLSANTPGYVRTPNRPPQRKDH